MPFMLPTFTVLLTFSANVAVQASATPISSQADDIFSESQLLTWLSTTDAKLTYIGAQVAVAGAGAGGSVIVVYCTTQTDGVCGGSCTVYTGGPVCLAAPGTNCLGATANVVFCSNEHCNEPCNQLNVCGVRSVGGFCFTPNTVSIRVLPVPPDNTTTSAPSSSETSFTSGTTSAPRSSETSVTSGTTQYTAPTSPGPASSSTAEESGQTSTVPQHSGISQRTALIAGPVVVFCGALLLVGTAILIFVKRRRRTRIHMLDIDGSGVSPIPLPAWRPDQQEPPPYIPIDATETQPGFVSEPPSTGKRRL